ncbi:MAG: hypothetical protein IJ300_14280, partial [Clostridia bacterium]|nr:hypothetical protein [Clostridia bacterium]
MTKTKSFRKLIASGLAFAMLLCFIPATVNADEASANVYSYEVELLEKLEIASSALTGRLTSKIKRSEFSEMLTAMLGVGGGGNAMEELYNLGIVHGYGNGKLEENNTITTYEAVKMVVNALGYETLAELEGGYPLGYVKVAYDVDILSGNVQNKELRVADAIRIMIDAGNAPVAKISNDALLHGIELGGKTMFYTYFDVVRIDGILTANGFTSLDAQYCIPGEVIINGVNYEVGDTKAADLLGYHVEAYAYDTDLTDVFIAAGPKADYNTEVSVIAGSYVQTSGSLASFTVQYEDLEGNMKKLKVGDGYNVVYNGKLYGGLTLETLDAALADVTYVDNDKDGIYELVKVEEYETYITETVDATKLDVYAKYDKSINLDPDKYDVFIYKSNGSEGEFADITPGTALSVLKSDDGDLIKVYILGKTAKGTVSNIATSGGHIRITIGGNSLVVTKEFENLVHTDKQELMLGANYTVVLDRNGNIVEVEMVGDVWTYGYITRIGYDETKETCTTMEIFDQSNKFVELSIGERLVVDGTSYKSLDLVSAGLCEMEGNYPKAVRQLVRYKAEGTTVKNIDTLNYDSTLESEDSLQTYTMPEVTGNVYFNKASGYAYSANDVVFGVDESTVMITVPADSTEKDAAYFYAQKMSGLSDRASLNNVTVYSVDDAKVAKVALRVYKDNRRAGTTNDYVIVKSVSTVINKDGEAVNKVEGVRMSDGASYSREATPRNKDTAAQYIANDVLNTTAFGDCLRYRDFNIAGYGNVLWSALKTFGPNDAVGTTIFTDVNANVTHADTYASGAREYVGIIDYADSTRMIIENADGTVEVPFKTAGAKIYVVDCADETITAVDAAAVPTYAALRSKVVVVTRGGTV